MQTTLLFIAAFALGCGREPARQASGPAAPPPSAARAATGPAQPSTAAAPRVLPVDGLDVDAVQDQPVVLSGTLTEVAGAYTLSGGLHETAPLRPGVGVELVGLDPQAAAPHLDRDDHFANGQLALRYSSRAVVVAGRLHGRTFTVDRIVADPAGAGVAP